MMYSFWDSNINISCEIYLFSAWRLTVSGTIKQFPGLGKKIIIKKKKKVMYINLKRYNAY